MKTDLIEFGICPKCGSTEYIEDYPVKGKQVCIKCGHENVIELKLVVTGRQILDICPFCGKEREDDDIFFERDDITVFKCRKCEKLDGYKFPDFSGDDYYFDFGSHDPLSAKIAEQEGKHIYSAARYEEFAEALRKKEKAREPIEKCKKQLGFLISNKTREMNDAGISFETIKIVREEVQGFLEREDPVTEKQLNSLFAAALYLIQKSDQIYYRKSLGKKVTEHQLEKIFGVTRKTIRKWKGILQKHSLFSRNFRLLVLTHQVDGQTKEATVEIPEEVESLTKLEKPYKDKCDFCQELRILCWRVRFIDGSWSDICENSYEFIEPDLKEQQIC